MRVKLLVRDDEHETLNSPHTAPHFAYFLHPFRCYQVSPPFAIAKLTRSHTADTLRILFLPRQTNGAALKTALYHSRLIVLRCQHLSNLEQVWFRISVKYTCKDQYGRADNTTNVVGMPPFVCK